MLLPTLKIATVLSAAVLVTAPASRPVTRTLDLVVAATGQQVVGSTYLETDSVTAHGEPFGLAVLTCPGAARAAARVLDLPTRPVRGDDGVDPRHCRIARKGHFTIGIAANARPVTLDRHRPSMAAVVQIEPNHGRLRSHLASGVPRRLGHPPASLAGS